ncbi:MAG: HEAT repeat domain-containing protein [Planctomycetes bacterium]|nr:HEAT repeat domain-containing protein [Planctomycetota bacterium]
MRKLLLTLLGTGLSIIYLGCGSTASEVKKPVTAKEPPPATKQAQPSELVKEKLSLIEELGSDDWETREKAQKELEKMGEKAEGQLKEAAKSANPEIRSRATRILKLIETQKRCKLSDGFLREFPNIYYNILGLSPAGKYELLEEVVSKDKNGQLKFIGKISPADIAVLTGEILREDGKGLTDDQKIKLIHTNLSSGFGQINQSGIHLIKLLKDQNTEIKRLAIETAGYMGVKEAIPEIRAFLKDPAGILRGYAAKTLGTLGDKESMKDIAALLNDSEALPYEVINALVMLGAKEYVNEIRPLLKSGDSSARVAAAVAMGNFGDKESIPQLMELLGDSSDSSVPAMAAEALGRLGHKEAIPKIIPLLGAETSDCREYSLRALTTLRASDAVPEIMKRLSDEDPYITQLSIQSLKILGSKELIPKMIQELQSNSEPSHQEPYLKIDLLNTSAHMMAKELFPEIASLLKDSDKTTVAVAAFSLINANIGMTGEEVPEITELLKKENVSSAQLNEISEPVYGFFPEYTAEKTAGLLSDKRKAVRASALLTLGNLVLKESTPEIIKMLGDKEPPVRATAISALCNLEAVNASDYIKKLYSDSDPAIRAMAELAIQYLKTIEEPPPQE